MYGLRPTVTALQGLWGSLRYWVGINGMPLIWDLLCVDRSLFCNTPLGGASRSWLIVSLCCVVYLRSINLSICMYFYVNNGLIPFRLPLASMVCGFFPCGRRKVLLFSNCGFLVWILPFSLLYMKQNSQSEKRYMNSALIGRFFKTSRNYEVLWP